MDLEAIRSQTSTALGLAPHELNHITQDLLEMDNAATPADLQDGDALGRHDGNRWGVFCHDIVVQNNRCYYSCGAKSASGDYGCDSGKRYYAPLSHATHSGYIGDCRGSNWTLWYVGNYEGGESDYGMAEMPEEQ